jgi:hypothetical protein
MGKIFDNDNDVTGKGLVSEQLKGITKRLFFSRERRITTE